MDVGSLTDGLPAAGDTSRLASAPATACLDLGHGWKALVLTHPAGRKSALCLPNVALTRELWLNWLRLPLSWFPPADKRDILKISSTTLVCRASLPVKPSDSVTVVCKRRVSRHWYKRLSAMVRISRPQRTWNRAVAMLEARLPTAKPLAVLERRRFGLLMESLLVTEYLRNAVDLEGLLTVRMRGLDALQLVRLKHELADGLAAFVWDVQKAGFIHRDLKALNVIVLWDKTSTERPRISVVDLDGMHRSLGPNHRAHLRMLMRLNVSVDPFRRVSLTDRVRVLRQYLLHAGRPVSEWKALWRELSIMSQRKRVVRARHQEKSFRKYGRY